MATTEPQQQSVLFDAGIFIGALLQGDTRHAEARPLVEQARQGNLLACTTTGILSEVYGALTWEQADPRHTPSEAAEAVRLLVEPPSAIFVLSDGLKVALRTLELAAQHQLTARRVHDARHAATALAHGIVSVHTYDRRLADLRGRGVTHHRPDDNYESTSPASKRAMKGHVGVTSWEFKSPFGIIIH